MNHVPPFLALTRTDQPADEAAVAAIVREANQGRTPVYPIGGGTNFRCGKRGLKPGVGLCTSNLKEVSDYAADDMTITVEAGITIAELGRRLALRRQRLPIDVPQAERATVGGVVAANTSGPRRYAHGTIRDFVLGIRAVDGRGETFSGGGRVVKNAAGYNVSRMMVGSLGTLGVITRVTLLVRPVPQSTALVACDLPDLEAAECLLSNLTRTQTLPVAIELLAGPAAQGTPPLPPPADGEALRLIVGLEGSRPEVEWMIQRLGEEWRACGNRPSLVLTDEAADPLWQWLIELPADVQISVLPSATVDMTESLLELVPGCSVRSHAGNGIIEAQFPALPPPVATSFAALLRDKLRPAVAAVTGNLVVLACPDDADLTCQDIWGPLCNGAGVMRSIKDRFDPHGILNPGRFIFDQPE